MRRYGASWSGQWKRSIDIRSSGLLAVGTPRQSCLRHMTADFHLSAVTILPTPSLGIMSQGLHPLVRDFRWKSHNGWKYKMRYGKERFELRTMTTQRILILPLFLSSLIFADNRPVFPCEWLIPPSPYPPAACRWPGNIMACCNSPTQDKFWFCKDGFIQVGTCLSGSICQAVTVSDPSLRCRPGSVGDVCVHRHAKVRP